MPDAATFQPVGIIHSCYKERFGIPRQPGLVADAPAQLELLPPYNAPEAVRGLEAFSHLWILFLFHQTAGEGWKATVRPPRLGGNARVGVFASRSNFRPNPIGLSVVELRGIEDGRLLLGGGDFLDGTPVIDIKPYLPYADSIPAATGAYAAAAPRPVNRVVFSAAAEQAVAELEDETRPALRKIVCDMLAYGPRPAYRDDEPGRIYGTLLFDLHVRWTEGEGCATVQSIQRHVPG